MANTTTQYRRPIRYSEATMKDAQANLQKLRTAFENTTFRQTTAESELADDQEKIVEIQALKDRFIEEMDDDFNAANGITVVYELAKWLNSYSEQEKVSTVVIASALEEFTKMLNVFGIEFQTAGLLDEEIDQLIEERNQARKDKNFARSDEIRDQLKEQGIILEDTPQGVRWRRA